MHMITPFVTWLVTPPPSWDDYIIVAHPTTGSSPYIIAGLAEEGHYALLVEASVGAQRILRLLNFDISNSTLPALQVTATQSLPDIAGNVRVQFSVNRAKAKFFCCLGGGALMPCKYNISNQWCHHWGGDVIIRVTVRCGHHSRVTMRWWSSLRVTMRRGHHEVMIITHEVIVIWSNDLSNYWRRH